VHFFLSHIAKVVVDIAKNQILLKIIVKMVVNIAKVVLKKHK